MPIKLHSAEAVGTKDDPAQHHIDSYTRWVVSHFMSPAGFFACYSRCNNAYLCPMPRVPIVFSLAFVLLVIIILILILIGHRISQRSGDARETQFLFQRLSVILQRFNAVLYGERFLAPSWLTYIIQWIRNPSVLLSYSDYSYFHNQCFR